MSFEISKPSMDPVIKSYEVLESKNFNESMISLQGGHLVLGKTFIFHTDEKRFEMSRHLSALITNLSVSQIKNKSEIFHRIQKIAEAHGISTDTPVFNQYRNQLK